MTDPTIALKEYLINIGLDGDADFLRQGLELLSQLLMEAEVEQQIGASRHERTPKRRNYRNGYRGRTWETRVGEIDLAIPKLRQGMLLWRTLCVLLGSLLRKLHPELACASPAGGEGFAGGDSRSLPERGQHSQSGCFGQGAGSERP